MGKRIEFDFKDKHYTLEYCRKTVAMLEESGFRASEMQDKMVTMLPMLFAGSFRMHHPQVGAATIDEIYRSMDDKVGLIERLGEMYAEPYEALTAEPDPAKKICWTAD